MGAPPKAKAPAKKAPAKAKNGYDSGSDEDDFDAKMDSGSDSDFKASPPPKAKRPNQQLLRKNCKILEVSVTMKTVSGPNLQPKRPKKRANKPNLRPLQKPKLHQRPKLRPKRPKKPLTVT